MPDVDNPFDEEDMMVGSLGTDRWNAPNYDLRDDEMDDIILMLNDCARRLGRPQRFARNAGHDNLVLDDLDWTVDPSSPEEASQLVR